MKISPAISSLYGEAAKEVADRFALEEPATTDSGLGSAKVQAGNALRQRVERLPEPLS